MCIRDRTGTVGAYTCLYLKENGYSVIAVGHRLSDNDFFALHGMEYYSVDVRNMQDFLKLPKDDIMPLFISMVCCQQE